MTDFATETANIVQTRRLNMGRGRKSPALTQSRVYVALRYGSKGTFSMPTWE